VENLKRKHRSVRKKKGRPHSDSDSEERKEENFPDARKNPRQSDEEERKAPLCPQKGEKNIL